MQLQNRKMYKKEWANNCFSNNFNDKCYCRGVSRIKAESKMELFMTKVNCF